MNKTTLCSTSFAELDAAYDSQELDFWMYDHAEELMDAPKIEMQTVF